MSRLLIIDDDDGIRRTLELHLASRFKEILTAETLKEGKAIWETQAPEIVILDLMLPDGTGTTLLKERIDSGSDSAVIMITGQHEMEYAVEAMKCGAFNFIHKPLDIHELDAAVEAARQHVLASKKTRPLSGGFVYRPYRIAGGSKAMLDIHKHIGLAAKSRVSVLVQGASGTGKELVARAIHEHSTAAQPFIALNCSAVVATLAESELFGHERGAFTGAHQRTIGKLELAASGTLFLDEIGDMPLELQAKLLRVIQERKFERVGGHEAISFDARIISATNRNLSDLVKEGSFREDLYFRLKVMKIIIPPLAERPEDIPDLVDHLLEKINRELHRKVTRVPRDIIDRLQSYSWPGNVRELENVLTQAVVRSTGDVLSLGFLREPNEAASKSDPDLRSLADVEKAHIQHILKQVNGNLGQACEILGITRPTLRKKMDDYGLRE